MEAHLFSPSMSAYNFIRLFITHSLKGDMQRFFTKLMKK